MKHKEFYKRCHKTLVYASLSSKEAELDNFLDQDIEVQKFLNELGLIRFEDRLFKITTKGKETLANGNLRQLIRDYYVPKKPKIQWFQIIFILIAIAVWYYLNIYSYE